MTKAPIVIAEIGCNHMGDMKIARELINVAATVCKVPYVKFQKRNARELLTPEQYNAPHPNPVNSFGPTYGAHREFLEFDAEQHRQLMAWCEEAGIGYATSVWDMTSAREIAALNPAFIKIPSATNLHFELLSYLCDNFGGQIHLSLGMTTRAEEDEIAGLFQKHGRFKDVVLYSCTSGYPVAFDEICLLEIKRLKEKFDGQVGAIAFSGHHLGIAADIAAFTLGAEWVERHFTLDRTWKGTDHAASLEPDGMRRLVRDLNNVAAALQYKEKDFLDVEIAQRNKLKWQRAPQEALRVVQKSA